MWLVGSEAVDVFLGREEVGVQCADGRLEWNQSASALQEWGQVARKVAGTNKLSARIWLSGAFACPFMLPAIHGLSKFKDAVAVAQQRALSETALVAPVHVHLADWREGASCLCVAVEAAAISAIEATARAASIKVAQVRPWWSAVLNDSLKDAPEPNLVTVHDGDALVLLAGEEKTFTTAAAYLPPPSAAESQALCQRIQVTQAWSEATVKTVHIARGGAELVVGDGQRRVPFVACSNRTP